VTSKTGHYKTTAAEFRPFLAFLRDRDVLKQATLCVPDTSQSTAGSWSAFSALEWLAGNAQRKTRDQVVQLLPGLEASNKNFWLKLAV
jgi:hypothetical protein